jgi:SAM-dependent methyltransferase
VSSALAEISTPRYSIEDNAALRELADRVTFTTNPASVPDDAADIVICVGADHIFGSQREALAALRDLVHPGGRLLFGTGFWERPPTIDEAGAFGAAPVDLQLLADLVDTAMASGFRLLDLRTATRREWEQFEFGYLADTEEWLMGSATHEAAPGAAQRSAAHRNGYLRGYRDVLGFAYLILGRPQQH